MTALAIIGAAFVIFIGLPVLYIAMDFAAEKIARALRDSIRP